MPLVQPEPFTAEELAIAEKIKKQLSIPEDIDSPFYVARFVKALNGDENLVKQRITEVLAHRKAIGYDQVEDVKIFTEFPMGKACFERFAISTTHYHVRSDNVHVFVQKMEGVDIKEIMKVIPLSYVLHSYFMLQENFSRVVSKTEKETGKQATWVTILDLSGLNLADFVNPLSTPSKLAKLVVKLWAEYFSENLCKLLIINSPGIVSIMWQITKYIMDAKTAARLHFLGSVDELKIYLKEEAIPVELGGTWRDDSGYSTPPESCVRPAMQVEQAHYRSGCDVWTRQGYVKPPSMKSAAVKGKQKHEISKKCTSAGQQLIWQFTVAGEIDFEIIRIAAGKEECAWPRVTLTSLKLAEFGSITCEPGEYVVRFTNPASTWFPVKMQYAVELK